MAKALKDIRASSPTVDRAKLGATSENDIRRHMAIDGSTPAGHLDEFVKRRPGQRGPGKKPAKEQVTLRVDGRALAAWRSSGPKWQARVNDLLVRHAPAGALLDPGTASGQRESGERAALSAGRPRKGTGARRA